MNTTAHNRTFQKATKKGTIKKTNKKVKIQVDTKRIMLLDREPIKKKMKLKRKFVYKLVIKRK